ncbi:MAG TPA: hypothetical protein PLD88_04445, partial [Candidatus Berkiella sp.]|nr:hypothetical protein [Candidatus Berkiella sp.]
FIAITENFPNLIEALMRREQDFNQGNVLGETIAHQVLKVGTKQALEGLKDLVERGYVNIKVQSHVFSNPFHYAARITDSKILRICFSMATADCLMQKNQIGESALSNAIAWDNADFLQMALERTGF